jgi:DUF4097 and DUF4098 domain-containing protein YvlB
LRHEFATPEPPRLRVTLGSGELAIETAETGETVVEIDKEPDDVRVEQSGREIVIEPAKRFGRGRSHEIRIRAPHGADAEVELASADVRARGRLGEVRVRIASGDVLLEAVDGRLDLTTASGDVDVAAANGGGSLRSASGDIRVRHAAGRLAITTASGDLSIESIAEGEVELKSASGDMRVGIVRGSRLRVDARSLSGDTSSELELGAVAPAEEGPLVDLNAASMSGDIRIVRA